MPKAPTSKDLNFGQKAGYGIAEIGMSAVELALQVYLLELYILAGLAPFWAGLALAIAVLWDAISDPLMGSISDRTSRNARFGNRIPYMIAGSILLGVSFYMLFSPSSGGGHATLFGQLLFWYLLVNTAMTLLGVPHLALVNDIGRKESARFCLIHWTKGIRQNRAIRFEADLRRAWPALCAHYSRRNRQGAFTGVFNRKYPNITREQESLRCGYRLSRFRYRLTHLLADLEGAKKSFL